MPQGTYAYYLDLLIEYVITWSPAFLAYLLLRTSAVRSALYFMMKKSKNSLIEPTEFEPGSANQVNIDSELLDSSFNIKPTEKTQYQRWKNALQGGQSSWWSFVRAIALFSLVTALLLYFSKNSIAEASGSMYQQIAKEFLPIILYVCVFIAVIINAARFYLLGYLPYLGGIISCMALFGLALLIAPVYEISWLLSAIPGGLLLAYYIRSNWQRLSNERTDGNHRLLILRVFDADKNTAFTFGELSHFWRFIGSTITVVDPSYLRFRYSLAYPRNKLRIMRVLLSLAFLLSVISIILGALQLLSPSENWILGMPHKARVDLLGMLAWLLVIPLALLPIFFTIKRRFISSEDELKKRLDKINADEVSKDGVYQDISLYCHSNAWKPAINSLVGEASAILMDLRGLTPDRAGSLYELDLVTNRVSLDRIVFLVNDEIEQQQLKALLCERLATVSNDSPNRMVETTNLLIYRPGRYDKGDNKRILSLLTNATARPGPGHIEIEKVTFSSWQRFKLLLAKPAQIWKVFSEQVDMTVSRPPIAYLIIPVLLTFVISLFAYRISPVLEYFDNSSGPVVPKLVSPKSSTTLAKTNVKASPLVKEVAPHTSRSEPPENSIEVLENYAFADWRGLSVRLDIRSEWADQIMEAGMVAIHRAEDEQQMLKILEVESASPFGPNLLNKMEPVSRGQTYSGSVDGKTEISPTNPHGMTRIWLRFEKPKSINQIKVITGDILVRIPQAGSSTRIELPAKTSLRGQPFTFPGLESLGEFKYNMNTQWNTLSLEYYKKLPKGTQIFSTGPNGVRMASTSGGSYSTGSGANKVVRYSKAFNLVSKTYVGFEIIQTDKLKEFRIPFHARNITVEKR